MFRLDSGKFPRMNYNRVIARAKRSERKPTFAITQRQVYGMWEVAQDMNSVREPQLAIKGRAYGQKRDGLI